MSMVAHRPSPAGRRRALQLAQTLATEVAVARASTALTIAQVARRAAVSRSTVLRVESGEPGVHLDTLAAVCDALGLNLSVKVFPAREPSLRDSGQLRIAQFICSQAGKAWKPRLEHATGDGPLRAADVVFFGADEIIDFEIERRPVDYQAQYRRIAEKRDALQRQFDRPVRLVMVVEDTRRSRSAVQPHLELIRLSLPATSADVWRSIRAGRPLGRDGLLWVRPWGADGSTH